MSYIERYFGKDGDKLKYEDVEHFFSDSKEESDKIEFKSYVSLTGDKENDKDKENGVIRSICAFLNSSGGLLIWGAPVGQNIEGRQEKVFMGALSPVLRLIEKDSFISRITDSITPAPSGIQFFKIEKDGKYIYLLDVEQSQYSPHQFRNIYYMRIDGQTKPAPHHYVEALFKKVTYPRLNGFIKIESLEVNNGQFLLDTSFLIFNQSRLQNEHELFIRIVVGKGAVFQRSLTNNTAFGLGGHEFIKREELTLYYNQPYRYREVILIKPHELQAQNSEFYIQLFFGGRNSPLMYSKYTIRIPINSPRVTDLNKLVVNMEENKPWFDYEDSLGIPEKERLNKILGR